MRHFRRDDSRDKNELYELKRVIVQKLSVEDFLLSCKII